MIRVLIVEDSRVESELLIRIISADREMSVVGIANDGEAAIRAVNQLKPDVVTMDIHMPILDGIETTRYIMQNRPTPIIIITNSYDPEDNYKSFQALDAGALAILKKPVGINHPNHKKEALEIIKYIKLMSEVRVIRRIKTIPQKLLAFPEQEKEALVGYMKIIAIGASTGGPAVIGQILAGIPKNLPIPIVIVQHIASGFISNFVNWLVASTGYDTRIACHGEVLSPKVAYFAPEDCHLTVGKNGRIILTKEPAVNGLRPSVARLFNSVAECYGKEAMGILLTGMGSDGAYELKQMKDAGAITIVQDSKSSIVYGMPGEAVKLGAARYILTPEQIVRIISELNE